MEKFIIIRICRPNRCADYFIEAVRHSLNKHPHVELWLVGEEGESTSNIKYFGIVDEIKSLLK